MAIEAALTLRVNYLETARQFSFTVAIDHCQHRPAMLQQLAVALPFRSRPLRTPLVLRHGPPDALDARRLWPRAHGAAKTAPTATMCTRSEESDEQKPGRLRHGVEYVAPLHHQRGWHPTLNFRIAKTRSAVRTA
jgi:hypothetical protein